MCRLENRGIIFFNNDLKENVCMKQPPSFDDHVRSDKVYVLRKMN